MCREIARGTAGLHAHAEHRPAGKSWHILPVRLLPGRRLRAISVSSSSHRPDRLRPSDSALHCARPSPCCLPDPIAGAAPRCSRGSGTTGRGFGRSGRTSGSRWGPKPIRRSSRLCRRCLKSTAIIPLGRGRSSMAAGHPGGRDVSYTHAIPSATPRDASAFIACVFQAAVGMICRTLGRSRTGIAISSGTRQCRARTRSAGPMVPVIILEMLFFC